MGPYCNFCDQRCFVRDPLDGGYLLATCPEGKAYDKSQGYNIDEARERATAVELPFEEEL